MFKNYLKTAWRNITKNKTFSFINIFGLATGLACCLLIASFLYDELNYDTYPEHANDLYRVELAINDNGNSSAYSSVDVAVGEGIKKNFPEVEAFSRLTRSGNIFFKYNDLQFKEASVGIADSNFLRMFSIALLQGDVHTALKEPHSIVLSKAYAQKYFGSSGAFGKSLMTSFDSMPYKVTGIFDKIPSNTHFKFDMIMGSNWGNQHTWSNVGTYNYLQLKPGASPKALEAKLPQLVAKYVVPEVQHDMGVSLAEAQKSVNTFIFHLNPVRSIHLHSGNKDELDANGSIMYVYIFGALAFFILLLACVNFTNLSTASSLRRSKEVGIRKVLGSVKSQLVGQFLGESILLTFIAMPLALLFVYLLLPYFNQVAGKEIAFSLFMQPAVILLVMVTCLLVGTLAGIYPAFFISSFNTISVLKSASSATTQRRGGLRSGLLVFQFAVSTALIISTLIVYRQLHYMQNISLGFNTSQVVVLNDTYLLGKSQEAFKNQLKQDSRVTNISLSRNVPVAGPMGGTQVYAKERRESEAHSEIHMNIYFVDYDYIPTLDMRVKQGRNFSPGFSTDSSGIVINEAAVRELGWTNTNPIGKTIVQSGQHEWTVVGVVRDFHYASAKEKIAPLMMKLSSFGGGIIATVNTADMQDFLTSAKNIWSSYHPGGPFSYNFLDEKFAFVYASEKRTGQIFSLFAILSVVIACLGLFGLSAYATQQRTKEIGLRKVLGASVQQILLLVSREFIFMVIIAFVFAVPVTWFAMHQWLQDFAYRISISWWVFVAGGILSVVIALLTVSLQAIKAAVSNPVKSLRNE